MVPGILIIILFAAFNLDEFEGELGAVALVIVSVLTFDLANVTDGSVEKIEFSLLTLSVPMVSYLTMKI